MPVITHSSSYDRELMAVMGETKDGIFVRSEFEPNKSVYINFHSDTGSKFVTENNNLEDLLRNNKYRVGIYKGDSITIQF